MADTRTTKRKRCNSDPPVPPPQSKKPRKPRRKPYGPFGPHTAADHALEGMTRGEATTFNDDRIKNIIDQIAGDPQTCAHNRVHKMTEPKLCYGKTDPRDAGRWYQKVLPFCISST